MTEIKGRIKWIDVAKGIAIILMVIGHSNLPPILSHWIFAFHMPLFFILSGITTHWNKKNLISFSVDKLKRLGIPFVVYSVLCICIIHVFNLASISFDSGWGDFALWFVPVLFVAIVITKVLCELHGEIRLILFLILPLVSVGLKYYEIVLPWNMSVSPYAAFFIMLGVYIKEWHMKSRYANILWMIASLGISLLISHYWYLDMAHNQCMPILPITIGAIVGSLFIFSVSKKIDMYNKSLSRFFQLIGRETFVILAFSQIIIMMFNKYCPINWCIKYCLLVIILYILIMLKLAVVKWWNDHIQI